MVISAVRQESATPSQNHRHEDHFDLRIVNLTDPKRKIRLEASLSIISDGDIETISQHVVKLLSDRSKLVRKKVYAALMDWLGTEFPPHISSCRELIFWRQKHPPTA